MDSFGIGAVVAVAFSRAGVEVRGCVGVEGGGF